MHKGQILKYSPLKSVKLSRYGKLQFYFILFIYIYIKKVINMFRILRLITYMDEIPITGVGY